MMMIMMQVSKDTDELAALTNLKPLDSDVPKKQLKEKVSAPRTHAMASLPASSSKISVGPALAETS